MSIAVDNDSGRDLYDVRVEYPGGVLLLGNIGKKWMPIDIMSYKRISPSRHGFQYILRYNDDAGEEHLQTLDTEYGPEPEWFGMQIIRITENRIFVLGNFIDLSQNTIGPPAPQ